MKLALGVATSVALSAAALIGSGAAWAGTPPHVVGHKYSDAQSYLSAAGYTPIVSTTVGDHKQWADCIVTSQVTRSVAAPRNSSGSSSNQVLVSLNCDNIVASAEAPGNSAGSPVGSQAAVSLTASAASVAASESAAAAEAAAAAGQGG
ncbi:hypothetical protein [Mycobacterium sp. OTB74]|uniref:hypothetical protein n=1 Tax=Mycobacterium sp. OTB74 TaxID=1853452 RepID=UPI0024736A0F|nr:hypothetical protein [Mycobacterium sp. OTB74]MDH6243282.1 hypothetical protein [Mycobacterium sp. OTB74]